jgi:fatty-acyl-CoA synthase
LNLRLGSEDLACIANHAGDRFLIVDDNLLPVYEKFKMSVQFERVLVVPHCGTSVPAGYESYEAFEEVAEGTKDYQEQDGDRE